MTTEHQHQIKTAPLGFVFFLALFFASAHVAAWLVSLPFIIKRLGGSDTEVGICIGMYMGLYSVGCLFSGRLFHHRNPKTISLIGIVLMMLAASGVCLVVIQHEKTNGAFQPVLLLTVLVGLTGLFASLFWPFVGGWVSMGFEGKALNRRLGLYNISWSSGGIIASLVSGYLVEINSLIPLLTAAGCLLTSFILMSNIRGPSDKLFKFSTSDTGPSEIPQNTPPKQLLFLWMSRVALLIGFATTALVQTQLGLLFKYELGFSESLLGKVAMIIGIANFLTMLSMGRWSIWHYKKRVLLISYIFLLLSLIIILNSTTQTGFFIAAILMGFGLGAVYSSHLYYGLSGSTKRSALVAIHEAILSAGFVIAAFVGGYLSDHLGRYWPYWFGVGLIILAVVVELVIYQIITQRNKKLDFAMDD